jgi:hypothetical protein
MKKDLTNGHNTAGNGKGRKLRSSEWFNNPHNPGMTALYLERYLNYGLTRHELQSGKPIIGIAQTGNDLSPCNRHHLEPAVLRWNFRCIRSRRPENAPPRRWIATSLISDWWRFCSAIPLMAWC